MTFPQQVSRQLFESVLSSHYGYLLEHFWQNINNKNSQMPFSWFFKNLREINDLTNETFSIRKKMTHHITHNPIRSWWDSIGRAGWNVWRKKWPRLEIWSFFSYFASQTEKMSRISHNPISSRWDPIGRRKYLTEKMAVLGNLVFFLAFCQSMAAVGDLVFFLAFCQSDGENFEVRGHDFAVGNVVVLGQLFAGGNIEVYGPDRSRSRPRLHLPPRQCWGSL